jgi:hypothetical protein
MTNDKQNAIQQRQQPSVSNALSSLATPDLALPAVRSMSSSRRDPIAQRAFLRSILDLALEIANNVEAFFSEDSTSDDTDDVEENSRSQNKNQ